MIAADGPGGGGLSNESANIDDEGVPFCVDDDLDVRPMNARREVTDMVGQQSGAGSANYAA